MALQAAVTTRPGPAGEGRYADPNSIIIGMGGAAFCTLRETLGLSLDEAGELLGASRKRVMSWELHGAPLSTANRLRLLDAEVEARVLESVDRIAAAHVAVTADARSSPRSFMARLIRYRTVVRYRAAVDSEGSLPYPVHCAYVGRLRIALERLGAKVEIEWG